MDGQVKCLSGVLRGSLEPDKRTHHSEALVPMHDFLLKYRDDLIARCTLKVSRPAMRAATRQQLANGIPLFIDQLIRTLVAELAEADDECLRISGPSGGALSSKPEMGVAATAHGKALLSLGYSVDQVVHDYGDLCQAITDLALERDEPFTISEFGTLNRCLDNAIADAVSEYAFQLETSLALQHAADENRRAGFLAHELRNALGTATLSLRAIELSGMPVSVARPAPCSSAALLRWRICSTGRSMAHAAEPKTRAKPMQAPRVCGTYRASDACSR